MTTQIPAFLRERGIVKVTDNLPDGAYLRGRLLMQFFGKAIKSRYLVPGEKDTAAQCAARGGEA